MRIELADLSISASIAPIYNAALHHAGVPLLSGLAVQNRGDRFHSSFSVDVSVAEHQWRAWIPALAPGAPLGVAQAASAAMPAKPAVARKKSRRVNLFVLFSCCIRFPPEMNRKSNDWPLLAPCLTGGDCAPSRYCAYPIGSCVERVKTDDFTAEKLLRFHTFG